MENVKLLKKKINPQKLLHLFLRLFDNVADKKRRHNYMVFITLYNLFILVIFIDKHLNKQYLIKTYIGAILSI